MKTAQHTPGPWRIGDAGHTVFGPPNGNPAPKVIAPNLSRDDARLIAAAPDLLQFARDFLAMWTAAGPTDSPMEAQARAVIAKAKGGDHV